MTQTYQITETSPLLHDVNCIYCHVDLALNDIVVVCDECDLPHHQECWQTNNNYCATFGCSGGGLADTLSVNVPVRESSQELSDAEQNSSQSVRPAPRFDRPPSTFSRLAKSMASSVASSMVALTKSTAFYVGLAFLLMYAAGGGLLSASDPTLRSLGLLILFLLLFIVLALRIRSI